MFSYKELLTSFRKGLRNGNWRRFSRLEKALYMASLGYAKLRGTVKNELLVGKLEVLVARLKTTRGTKIFKRGFEKAVALLRNGEEEGIFGWAPSLQEWLNEPDYVFWLGMGGLSVCSDF